ncbi:MAG: HAMP domain-containing protein [Chloracidobacterium sp.]|nr:HAMP domain-containing protein [Chloracidobacterium sp.]
MKLSEKLNTPSSFRAQMVSFIALMLALTMAVMYYYNQQLEERTTRVVNEYIQEIPIATDLVYRSLSTGKNLYDLVNQPGQNSLPVNSESSVRHIFIVDEEGKIFDSADKRDIERTFAKDYPDIAQSINTGDLRGDLGTIGDKRIHPLHFSITTTPENEQPGVQKSSKRDIYIVLYMKRLQQVKASAERDRFIALVLLGLLLIVAIAIFTRRITRPIIELSGVAEKVAEGNLDFSAPVSGPKEIRVLSQTFNEMLSGMRSKRNLEELLQRAERSAVVGRLASGIAHEIRNPLNFINLSIDHLRASFAPKEDGPRAQYIHMLTTIKDELARLNRLVSDFLGYGRPAKIKMREIDARSLIEEVRDLVNTHAEQHAVTVNIKQDGDGDSKLQGDAELIKTCFSNLMINAIQAMPGGGELNISMRSDNGFLEIKFADTGVGIMQEDLAQIFEPYYSTKETGIGLGLPLTKKIIEEHGGKINVESGLGRGTTFTVTLLREP